jgi:hypothetical protein
MLGSCKRGKVVPAASVVENGHEALALLGVESRNPAKTNAAEAVPKRITPRTLLEPYAYLPLVFCEEARGEFLEGKIGIAMERQRFGSVQKRRK